MKKRYFLALILFCLSLLSATFVYWPLKYVEFKNYAELIWLGGVKYKAVADVAYLEKNTCSEENLKDCVCVMMIHGLADSAITWKNIFKNQKQLSKPTQMIALDLPGAGASPFLDSIESYKVNLLAQKYNTLAKELCDSKDIILVGNSLGGWISSWMLRLNPELYHLSLLLNPAGMDRSYDKVVGNLIDPSPEKLISTYKLSHTYGKHQMPLPWFIARHASARMQYFPVEEMIKAQSFENLFLDSFLKNIAKKSFVIWGEDDKFLDTEHAQAFQALLPSEHFALVKDCAHIPQSQCTEQVIDFLNQSLVKIK